jgi:hypothetical protein
MGAAFRLESSVVSAFLRSHPGALTGQPSEVTAMAFTSTIQIFKLDEVKSGIGKSGKPYEIRTAQCALVTDEGAIEQVGVLDIPEGLKDKAKPGRFRGVFALQAAQFGDQRGKIRAVLTDLTLVPAAK